MKNIKEELVKDIAKMFKLDKYISSTKYGYTILVGEKTTIMIAHRIGH